MKYYEKRGKGKKKGKKGCEKPHIPPNLSVGFLSPLSFTSKEKSQRVMEVCK